MHPQSGATGQCECTGTGTISVSLIKKPHSVKVKFRGEPTIISCNPVQTDALNWAVEEKHGRHKSISLVIAFTVVGTREIEWDIFY
jgi:hypothetical protein